MGKLNDFNLQYCIDRYNTRSLVETGTGVGNSIRYALQFPFLRLDSCEIVSSQAAVLRETFGIEPRVNIVCAESAQFLRTLLSSDLVSEDPILFYLDAHYPGSDLGLSPYDAEQKINLRLPLERELRAIKECRPKGRDVIIADDLRIYKRANFDSKNLDEIGLGHIGQYNDAKFAYELFLESHTIEESIHDTGYLIFLPKG